MGCSWVVVVGGWVDGSEWVVVDGWWYLWVFVVVVLVNFDRL